jgi:hypothetical protein
MLLRNLATQHQELCKLRGKYTIAFCLVRTQNPTCSCIYRVWAAGAYPVEHMPCRPIGRSARHGYVPHAIHGCVSPWQPLFTIYYIRSPRPPGGPMSVVASIPLLSESPQQFTFVPSDRVKEATLSSAHRRRLQSWLAGSSHTCTMRTSTTRTSTPRPSPWRVVYHLLHRERSRKGRSSTSTSTPIAT